MVSTLLNESEATQILGLSQGTLAVWRCNKRYQIPYVKVGRAVRYRLDDINMWIDQNTIK